MTTQHKVEDLSFKKVGGGKWLHQYHIFAKVNGKEHGPYEMVSRRNTDKGQQLRLQGEDKKDDAVVIIAFTEDKKLVVIREYRLPIGGWIWAFPAGCVEPGQSDFDCAQNELQQETGLVVFEKDVIRKRRNVMASPGMTDETATLIWCKASGTPHTRNTEESEIIEVHLIDLEQLRKILDSGDPVTTQLAAVGSMLVMQHDHANENRLLA